MRADEFITEVNMAPGTLEKFLNTPIAQSMYAGFEAEVCFKDALGEYGMHQDTEYPDVDENTDISDIKNYFSDNGGSDFRKIEEEYDEYVLDAAGEWVSEEADRYITTQIKDGMLDPDDETGIEVARDEINDDLYSEFFNRHDLVPTMGAFLNDRYMVDMEDVAHHYNLDLPYIGEEGGHYNYDVASDYADKLRDIIKTPIYVSNEYHGTKKKEDTWYFEPDSSIEPDDDVSDLAVEIVSPPMPVMEMFQKMEATFNWIKSMNGYTNTSTGFHVGISLPGKVTEDIDYVKLALFLGDQYVLNQFQRQFNNYARSSAAGIKTLMGRKFDQESIQSVVKELRQGFLAMASMKIVSKNNDKYVTINYHDDYIEFRSMGGDYLNDWDKVKGTILRYIQATAIAADELAYEKEYGKKLYALVQQSVYNQETGGLLTPFMLYSMGQITRDELKRQLQVSKMMKQQPATVANPEPEVQGRWARWFVTFNNGTASNRVAVSARNHNEARAAAVRITGLPDDMIQSVVLGEEGEF